MLFSVGAFEAGAEESSPSHKAPILKDFETDYCTMFSEGTSESPNAWKQCCFDHDLRFWFGGSEDQRDLADTRLRDCVEQTGHPKIAKAMYYGVRAGKHSPIKNKYQWGWGWDPFEGYKPLDDQQKETVRKSLGKLDLSDEYLKKFKEIYNL